LVKGSGRDTLIVVNNTKNNEQFIINTGFTATSLVLDPDQWLITGTNGVFKVSASSGSITDISLYPNPAHNELNIDLLAQAGSSITFSIYSSTGDLVLQSTQNTLPGSNSFHLPIANLYGGLYLLKIKAGDTVITEKFVKQ
jgi:hypothetical protein